jgi:hypothetical protein
MSPGHKYHYHTIPSMSYNSVAAAHGKLNKFSKLDIKINAAGMMVIVI